LPKKKSSTSGKKDIGKISDRVKAGIQRASEINDPFKILIYGRPGKKKTRTLATLPNVLIVDINDRGTRSTKRDLDPHVYIVNRLPELDDIYWFLAEGDHKFESVGIDGVTSMQSLALKFVMNDEAIRDASRDPHMASKPIWGKANELCKEYITNYRNLPMHVGFTALERSRDMAEDEEEESQIVIAPAVSPGVANHLEAAVGTIGHITTKEVRVKKGKKTVSVVRTSMRVGPSERYITKDRDGLFGSVVREPHLGKMIQQIEGGE
jgi:hypothetical protein